MDINDYDFEASFMDELFTKIQQLEKEKLELENKLDTLNKELTAKELKELIQYDDRDAEILKEIKLRNEDQSLRKVMKNQEDSLKEVVIQFVPFDNFNELYIIGDFTNWQKEKMIKQEGASLTFNYKTLLMKGYQYSYYYMYNEEVLIDFNQEYLENPQTGMTNNIINLESDIMNDNSLAKFDSSVDYPILEQMRDKYKQVLIEDSDEFEVFNKIVHFSNFIKNNIDDLNILKQAKLQETKNNFDEKLAKLNLIMNSKFGNVKEIFQDRILTIDNQLFLIKNLLIKEGIIKGVYLYDKNNIKINIEYHISSSQLESIDLNNIFNYFVYINTKEESENLMKEYQNDNKNILKIYYELLDTQIIEDENNLIIENMNPNRQKELIPYKIFPETVDINQYDIGINNNIITEVRNKENHLSVKFEAIMIKEETGGKMKGLVSSSSLKVYTSLYNKDIVNIIHIHLNDTSEEIAVDSVFLEKNQSVNDHKNFPLDAMGKKLNYKFLFRDYKLVKIFYNLSPDFIDEPQFEEIRVNSQNFFRVTGNVAYLNYYGKIRDIPICMLARKDKDNTDLIQRLKSKEIKMEGFCLERHLDELPGHVDVELFFDPDGNMIKTPIKLTIPICNTLPLTIKEMLAFEKRIIKAQNRETSDVVNKLAECYQEFKGYFDIVSNSNLMNEMGLEQAMILMQKLEIDFKGMFGSCLEDENNLEVFFNLFLFLEI